MSWRIRSSPVIKTCVFVFLTLCIFPITGVQDVNGAEPPIFEDSFEAIAGCGVPPQLGPWVGHPLYGSNVTTTEYGHDAGLDDVIAAAPAAMGESATGLTIQVSGAIIHNIGYPADKVFWMADGNGAFRTFLPDAVNPAPQPGDAVSFTVTEIENYHGELEITGLTNWSVDSGGNSVLVRQGQGVELTEATLRYTYETYGKIVSAIGACGSNTTCWNFEHGGVTSELRIKDDVFALEGDCLHVIAPVYYAFDNGLFDIQNWDWKTFYQP